MSLPEAQKLARHTDITMTMKYTHIGMEDRAKAIQLLACQWNGSASGVSESQPVTSDGTTCHKEGAGKKRKNPDKSRGFDVVRQPVSSNDTNDEKWRRRELNPRPVIFQRRHLRV